MKIKELHPDIERYLNHDCYCPHEVYSSDGFFYQLFYEDQECEKIGENKEFVCCIAHPDRDENAKPQLVFFYTDGEKCFDSIRYDATQNNIEMAKMLFEKGFAALKASGRKFDEYEKGATAKSLKEILSIADAVMFD